MSFYSLVLCYIIRLTALLNCQLTTTKSDSVGLERPLSYIGCPSCEKPKGYDGMTF